MNFQLARKVFYILTERQRRRSAVLIIFMFIGMCLEIMSIGMMIPAITLMTQPELTSQYSLIGEFMSALGNPSQEVVMIGGLLVLLSLYFVKSAFLVFMTWQQNVFAYSTGASLSLRLFSGYLKRSWIFHVNHNSAQLIRNTTTDASIFINSVLIPVMRLLTEVLILTGLLILMSFVEPLGVVVVIFVLGLTSVIYYQVTRGYLLEWGRARQFHEGMRIQHLQQGFGGAKDLKLLGREAEFVERYSEQNTASANVLSKRATVQQIPRIFLELLAAVCLVLLVLVTLRREQSMISVLPTLGMFAAAAFRLLPSANRMIDSFQNIRFGLPVISTLYEEISSVGDEAPIEESKDLHFFIRISLRNICYRYPGADRDSLTNINLSIEKNSSVGIFGESGSGKSTLIDVILGLLSLDRGSVEIDGVDIQTNLRGWQDRIGYVPQNIYLSDDSLRRNIAFGLPNDEIDADAIDSAIRSANLEAFVSDLPNGLETKVGERGILLSGGQRQRIGIARALYGDPEILVLDEATSSLDSDTEEAVIEAVKLLGGQKTIIMVAHRLSTIGACDKLYRFSEGEVVEEGTPTELLSSIQIVPR